MRQLSHFGQLIRSPRFQKFDYGIKRNFFIYNRSTPPEYRLNRCTVHVGIIYSEHDSLNSPQDVRRLPKELPNVIAMHLVDDDTFNHIDFVWATDAKELVYDHVIDWMKMEEQRQKNGHTWSLIGQWHGQSEFKLFLAFDKIKVLKIYILLKNLEIKCVSVVQCLFHTILKNSTYDLVGNSLKI